ncbi:hypothetical protein ABKV19_002752 [Rosa sericea]
MYNVVRPGGPSIRFYPLTDLEEFLTVCRLAREKKEKEAKAAVEEPPVAAVGERCEICGDGHSTVTCSYDDIGLDSDVGSDEEIPEGYTRASLHYSTKANGERIRGPAVRVVPMVCFRCYKFGDHRPENCPGKVSVDDRTPRSQESRTSESEGGAAVTG